MATEVERKAAAEVAEVARRLQETKETYVIDLVNCGLMKIPDAMYMILRNTPAQICLLSHNQLKKISPKFPVNFTLLKELDLSDNKISEFPEEMTHIGELQSLDISGNLFPRVPDLVYQYNKLQTLRASRNNITDVDVDQLAKMPFLEEVDFRGNPLLEEVRCRLLDTHFRVLLDDIGTDDCMNVD